MGKIKLAINGFGRIGRNILRALYENNRFNEFDVVAINDLGDAATNAYLLQHDSVHGKFKYQVMADNEGYNLVINHDGLQDKIQVFQEKDPRNLPWGKLAVDLVLECSGQFTSKEKSLSHISAGAKKVLISAPAGNKVDATIVYGVNHSILTSHDLVISNASCTTNCLAPLVKPIHESCKINAGLMTTIHSYTNDQVLVDVYHQDLRRGRSATVSMIPTKTGAAAAIGLVIPELDGKLDGFAMRVPTINVSVVDLTLTLDSEISVNEINKILIEAANNELKSILEVNNEPLVSIDFNHNPASCIADLTQTKVIGKTVKLIAWYDNEWGFSNRMLDTAKYIGSI